MTGARAAWRRVAPVVILLLVTALPALSRADALATAIARRDEWRRARLPLLVDDFGEQNHFRKANAAVGAPRATEKRVIFFGDSITAGWSLATSFPGRPYLNRGIGGQTTPQLLVRFRQDVIDLRPAVVVILAGTNDLAGLTGPLALEDTERNLASMAELARVHQIEVVLASVTPVNDYTPETVVTFPLRPPEKIVELDRWLKSTCAAKGYVYLDYFTALADGNGKLRKDLAADGLHPNRTGYQLMAPLADQAIAKALDRARSLEHAGQK